MFRYYVGDDDRWKTASQSLMFLLKIRVPGDIFAAPGPELSYKAVRLGLEASGGEGVLLVFLNHPADMMSADIVMERVRVENFMSVKLQHAMMSPLRDSIAKPAVRKRPSDALTKQRK